MAKPLTNEEMAKLARELKEMQAETYRLNVKSNAFLIGLRSSLYGTSASAHTGSSNTAAGTGVSSTVQTDPGTGAGQTKANI